MSVKKARSECAKWKKAVSDGKRPKGREPHEPPTFENLPQTEIDRFNAQSDKDIPWGYYRIHSCYAVQSSSSSSSSAVTHGSTHDSPERFTMFETHYQNYERAKRYYDTGRTGDKLAVITHVPYNVLLTSCYWLSKRDVATSDCLKDLPSECVECSSTKNLSWCDGHRFLLRGPAAFPCQSFGVCKTCRPLHYYRGTKSYLCPRCVAEPATVENLYGFNITTPRDNTKMLLPEKNVVLPAGAPVLKYGTEWNPAKVFLEARTAREAKAYVSTLENKRQELSFILKSAFTTASISQGQERILLKALSELQDRGLATFQGVLAKKPRTLKSGLPKGTKTALRPTLKYSRLTRLVFYKANPKCQSSL